MVVELDIEVVVVSIVVEELGIVVVELVDIVVVEPVGIEVVELVDIAVVEPVGIVAEVVVEVEHTVIVKIIIKSSLFPFNKM